MSTSVSYVRTGLRRHACVAIAALTVTLALPTFAERQDGPVTLLVGFPPGGGADFAARVLAEKLAVAIERPVIVDNRPGAGGQIAARLLKGATADGSVLFMSNAHTLVTVPNTVRKPGYEVSADFRPVSNFANFETVLVSSTTTGATSFASLRRWAQTQPKGVPIGVPSAASIPEFISQALGKQWKVDVQAVPYRGVAPLVQDLLSDQVPIGIVTSLEAINYGKTGKLTAVAVSHRTPLLPDVPSFSEVGLSGLDATDFLAVYAPAATPDAVVEKYELAIKRIAAMPDVVQRLRGAGQEASASPPAIHAERVKALADMVAEFVRSSAFKPE